MGHGFTLATVGMVLLATAIVSWPFLREGRWASTAGVFALIAAGSFLLYPVATNFEPRSAAFVAARDATDRDSATQAADALYEELMAEPDDYSGWRLLGDLRLRLGQYPEAVFALRQAMDRASGPDAELMLLLGEALGNSANDGRLPSEAIVLFIGAYGLAPDNPRAQWYGGLGYAAQGDSAAAADAWDALLANDPPADVAAILRERVAALRASAGDTPPAAQGRSLTVDVSLDGELLRDWPEEARLYLSVRDPERPGPPLAAVQYQPSVLPIQITLDDGDAMLAGRNLSSAERYRIVARVSLNGDPVGGVGDPIGTLTLAAGDIEGPVALVIDEVVSQ